MLRARVLVLLITPKVALPNAPPGLSKFARLNRLNVSIRNCSRAGPVLNDLNSERSHVISPAPYRVLSPTLPSVFSGWASNAAVLNQRVTLRSLSGSLESPI